MAFAEMGHYKAKISSGLISFFLISILLFNSLSDFTIIAQAQKPWKWVSQVGSSSWDISAGVASDSKNNLYVAGTYPDTLNFEKHRIESNGNRDIFVTRFTETGSLSFMLGAGGRGEDMASCICITPENNVIIGGIIHDTATFGKLQEPGLGKRLFVAAIDAKGNFLWVRTLSGSGDASLLSAGSDSQGRIFVSGLYSGEIESGNQKIKSKGRNDIFLGRFSKSGLPEKLFSIGSTADESLTSMSLDASASVVIAGSFNESFESGKMKFQRSPARIKTNAFIAKYDYDFQPIWVNVLAGRDFCEVSSLKHDKTGDLYAAGSFNATLEAGDKVLKSQGYTDGFLLKYMPDGKLAWYRSFGSLYYDYASHVNADNLEGAVITGSMGSSMKVDSLYLAPPSPGNSALIIQFSSEGKAVWADFVSGSGRNFSSGSVLDRQGNLYFAGSFRNSFEKAGRTVSSFGDQDIFLAKYFNCPDGVAEISGIPVICPGAGTELSIKRGYTNIIWNDSISDRNTITAENPGLYHVSMLDKNGCLLTDTVLVNMATLPVFSLGNDTTLALTDTLLLGVPHVYTSYRWQDESSWPQFLASSADRKPGTFQYSLEVTDSLGCSYSDTISVSFLYGSDRMGIAADQLVTYPNPASTTFSWFIKTGDIDRIVAELTDENGRIIYREEIYSYRARELKQVSVAGLAQGPYILTVYDPLAGKILGSVRVIKR